MTFVCAYLGRPGECPECGGHNPTGTRFCSHDCAASHADRAARHEAAEQARRDQERAFGDAVQRLRNIGHGYQEIDLMLAGIPT